VLNFSERAERIGRAGRIVEVRAAPAIVRRVGRVGKGIAIYFSIEFSSFFISVFLL